MNETKCKLLVVKLFNSTGDFVKQKPITEFTNGNVSNEVIRQIENESNAIAYQWWIE